MYERNIQGRAIRSILSIAVVDRCETELLVEMLFTFEDVTRERTRFMENLHNLAMGKLTHCNIQNRKLDFVKMLDHNEYLWRKVCENWH